MKKIILTTCLACVMAFSLAACGGGSSSGAAATSGSSSASSSSAASGSGQEQAAVAGEEYDVGDFTIFAPSGWMVVPQRDMLADADENGEYPISPDSIGLIKDGEDEWDAFSKPTIYVYKYEGDAAEQAETTAMFYDETEDLELTINGKECPAFEAKSAGLSDDDSFYVYDIVFIPVNDEVFFQANIPVDMIDFEGVNLDDADVKAILESLKLK